MKLYFWLTSFLLWSPHLNTVVNAQQQQQRRKHKQRRQRERDNEKDSSQSQFNYQDYIPKGENAEKLKMFFGPRHVFEGLFNTLKVSGPMILVGTASFVGFPLYGMFGNLSSGADENDKKSSSSSEESSSRRNRNDNNSPDNNGSSTTTKRTTSLGKRVMVIVVSSIVGGIFGGGCYLVGAIFAIWQLIVGIIRTPKTIWSWMNGKTYWKENKWTKYNLTYHSEELLDEENSITRAATAADDSLYKVLDVHPTASSKEIKRAYYKLAKELHPDKQPDKEDEFRKVHSAYETLYNEETRKTYDEWGFSASSDSSKQMPFDPSIFFDVLFGTSPELENYIGDLGIKSFATSLCQLVFMSSQNNNQDDSNSERQQMMMQNLLKGLFNGSNNRESRQIDIAIWIRDFTASYVNGTISQDEFQLVVDEHANNVEESTPFPTFFLETIGKSLYWEGKGYIGSSPLHIPYSLMSSIRNMGISIDTMRFYLIKWYYLMNEFYSRYDELKEEEKLKSDSDDIDDKQIYNQILQDMVPTLLEYVWRYNQNDIITTIRGACWKLLHDHGNDNNNTGISNGKRRRRQAKALEILGNSFLKIVKLNQQECSYDNSNETTDSGDGSNSNNKEGRRSSSFMNDTDRVKIAIQMATKTNNNNNDYESD